MLRCNGSVSELSTRVVDLTAKEKKSDSQNMSKQRKMAGLPSRRRRFMDTGDSGPYCMMLQNNEKNTGRIVRACVRASLRARVFV